MPIGKHMRKVWPVLLAAALAACQPAAEVTFFDLLEPCRSDDGPNGAYCGALEVAEDPDSPDGRLISLKTVVLPAFDAEAATDPVFFLAGGPGQGAASISSSIHEIFHEVRRERDVILVDQRGTGDSNLLKCKFFEDEFAGDDTIRQPPPITKAEVDKCLADFEGDPRFYTTSIAMDDIDRVREWLGFEKINLFGGSYGTRAALVYLRRHPERVRTAVLDGVAPPGMSLPLYFPRDSQRALDLLMEDCAQDDTCNERFPQLDQRFRELIETLDRNPHETTVRHPRTASATEAVFSRQMVTGVVRQALYSPLSASLVPLAIERAADGDFGPLAALMFAGEGMQEQIANGLYMAVTCSEDYPRITPQQVEEESRDTFVGTEAFRTSTAPCEHWPTGAVPPAYYEPVVSDVPVLILSGELDPVTPPSWGEQVAAHLSNSRHIVAPGTAHGVMTVGCGMRLIAEFLSAADPSDLDASCLDVQQRPPFFVRFTGPFEPADTEENQDD